MRVLFYHPRAAVGDGGMTSAVRLLSHHLAHAGVDVTIAFDDGAPPLATDGVHWAPVRHAGPRRFRLPIALDSLVRDSDLLVVHSGWVLHNVVAARFARTRGVPLVLSPRGAYDPMIVRRRRLLKRAWRLAAEDSLLQQARAVHVFFSSEDSHLRALGYRGGLIVAPNGVAAPDGVRWDGGSGGYLLWLGRFDPEHKGLDLVLAAMSLLPRAERPPLRLHGPDSHGHKRHIARLIDGLGLQDRVTLGEALYGDAKWALLRRARGFVYPSRWEAFGNAAAEAVSIGLPTLVTPYPLGRYLASHGGAILVDATPRAIAAGIRTLGCIDASSVGTAGAGVVADTLTWGAAAESWRGQLEAVR